MTQTIVCPNSLYEFLGDIDGVPMTLWYDYTPAERGSYYEPSYDASIEICNVMVNGVELGHILSDKQIAMLEEQIYKALDEVDYD